MNDARLAHAERYAERLNDAARHACATYLDGIGHTGPARKFSEFDQLTEDGKALWRDLVTRAVYDMLPVIRHEETTP